MKKIRKILIEKGREHFRKRKRIYPFTKVAAADRFLNNLDKYPHAFVLACLADQQMKAEKAWLIPYEIYKKLGGFSFRRLKRLTIGEINRLMTKPDKLHHYPKKMSKYIYAAIKHISEKYNGDASLIWRNRPSSAQIVLRFILFRGMGIKIATMAANILARDLKVPMRDHYSIDISPDRHVKRTFKRLGLITPQATNEELIYCARALHPEFPGLLDYPAYTIGKNWCRPGKPLCDECHMTNACPKIY
ncbi:MAG: iron-sulfur cluster loop [Planctomycetota bacterium]|nr:MAG: iron-sulfur cluster loop [Planctomycetota bacterium]